LSIGFSSVHELILVSVAALLIEGGLAACAFLIEFSERKKRPAPAPRISPEAGLTVDGHDISIAPGAEPFPLERPRSAQQAESAPEAGLRPAERPKHLAVSAEPAEKSGQRPLNLTTEERLAANGTRPPSHPAYRLGLLKTRESFLRHLRLVLSGRAKAEEIYQGLEEALLTADVGIDTSLKLVEAVRSRLGGESRPEIIRKEIEKEVAAILTAVERPSAQPVDAPLVVLLVGVNGAGKTTTIAKLAAKMRKERGQVIVAAADTFRAAAIEQLEVWCERVGATIIKQKPGSDPAAVAFDAVKAARSRKAGTVLIDTAGRLQTKANLMEELKKVSRVIARELPGAPHETWLVLDATAGQNALSQAKLFGEAVSLTGIVLAKLDSTAKGGIVVAIADQLRLPVRFVGIGEAIDDLVPFDAREFSSALFAEDYNQTATSSSYVA
jgi:fused signal recognition particle receptor